ncbi:precorrin-6A/cobalt-precorrin-6A reductase [Pseudofrankia sp. BMG5.36]|uniref:precorrin-6A/cobalt-precorrin-6A reductase n=2 Tax=unclassified Pseudofrankia TaxID=2994372 RepID=UPI0032D584C2
MSAHAVAACASTSVDEEPGGQAAAPEPAPARAHSPLAQPSPAEPGPAEGSAAPGPTGPGPTKGSTGEGSPSGDRQHEDGYGGDRPREGGAVPLLRLARPGWTRRPGDDWHRVPHLAAAAERARALCPPGSAVFVTTGRRQLAPFAADPDRHYVIRAVDPPADLLPTRHTVLLDRGPYTIDGETRLLRDHRIRVLVTKDSGGDLTVAKLDAARALGLPVVMVDRPTVTGPVPPTWPNVDGVLAALRELASAVA